jgi:hypothetical protein
LCCAGRSRVGARNRRFEIFRANPHDRDGLILLILPALFFPWPQLKI